MSDDEENYSFYGKPLEPYDEDAFPKKRPVTVEEQIATDAQGRRRFHGAFTGGFSAGFFNTVGSLEGWKPSEFRSSRSEKSARAQQNPSDFMDDEDLGEFGIAPERVKATKDFSTSKRKRKAFSDGPIPGEPVLHSLITAGNETIGYLLLKNMGIGDKVRDISSGSKVYGCEMPKMENEDEDFEIPELYKEFLTEPKTNTGGLGYVGLDKTHVNLFVSPNLVVHDKNKKLSIRGQAFGVGAFEKDDSDIYEREDMSNYDFEITKEEEKIRPTSKSGLIFDTFRKVDKKKIVKETFPPPAIPHSFTGKYKKKKSRFEPIVEPKPPERKKMNAESRAQILAEHEIKKENPIINALLTDKFVSAGPSADVSDILKPVEKFQTEHGTKEQRDAVKLKMFGPLTRTVDEWNPCSLICKRFNVPEPNFDKSMIDSKRKRTKNLIFEYQKHHEENTLKPGLSTKDDSKADEENPAPPGLPEVKTEPAEVEAPSNEPKRSVAVDPIEKLNTEDKVDLFKAVFSSSESEDEEERADEEKTREEEIRSNVLSAEMAVPKIRPIKEGILSNIDFSKMEKKNEVKLEGKEANLYGPRVPEVLPVSGTMSDKIDLSSDSDEWVEKGSEEKKRKKHKKEKKNKKKHKHKKDKRNKR